MSALCQKQLAGGRAEPGGMERLGRRLVAINRFGSGVSAASKSWAAGQHVQYPPQARWGTHVLGCVPNVQCASRVPGLGLVRCLIDLLDFRDPFQQVFLGILEIGEEHIPGAVPARSIHAPHSHVA